MRFLLGSGRCGRRIARLKKPLDQSGTYPTSIGPLADQRVRPNNSGGSIPSQLLGHYRPVYPITDLKEPIRTPHDNHLSSSLADPPNHAAQSAWQSTLRKSGIDVTGVRDRKYFRSIYFHSPGGVLFEIATDPPGFSVDEPVEKLGAALKLPDQYEHIRSDIEKRLPDMKLQPGI